MRTREEQARDMAAGIEGDDKPSELLIRLIAKELKEAERRAEQRVRADIARDSERLDWLERGFKSCAAYMNGDVAFSPGISVRNLRGSDFRSAIDAAREVG